MLNNLLLGFGYPSDKGDNNKGEQPASTPACFDMHPPWPANSHGPRGADELATAPKQDDDRQPSTELSVDLHLIVSIGLFCAFALLLRGRVHGFPLDP